MKKPINYCKNPDCEDVIKEYKTSKTDYCSDFCRNQYGSTELKIPSVRSIQMLLEPIYERLANIEKSLKNQPLKSTPKKYYRNADLKSLFGLSSNTIIKYRETGTLPYTRLGDVYLYEVNVVEQILKKNNVCLNC